MGELDLEECLDPAGGTKYLMLCALEHIVWARERGSDPHVPRAVSRWLERSGFANGHPPVPTRFGVRELRSWQARQLGRAPRGVE